MKIVSICALCFSVAFIFSNCTESVQKEPPVVVSKKDSVKTVVVKQRPSSLTYRIDTMKRWLATQSKDMDSMQQRIILAVNRTDKANLKNMKTLLVPSDLSGDLQYYLPFPASVPALKDVNKILFFSYPAQSFAAYQNGELVYTGQTNMGRKKDPTPTGLYYTNWKAEQTTSTFNDEWDLKWNFNIENKEGIGFHQYALPGYPASHSCLRLTETDAKYLYNWADQWILQGTDNIIAKGTPVVVFGVYNFDGPKPWLKLANDPKALDISVDSLQAVAQPYLADILAQQQKKIAAGKG